MSDSEVSEIVVVELDRGFAFLRHSEWTRIQNHFTLITDISKCRTWGEYRSLGSNEFDDEIWDLTGVDEEPEDSEPFSVDLTAKDDLEDSRYNISAALEAGTSDFLDSLPKSVIPHGAASSVGPWAWVQDEPGLTHALERIGFRVVMRTTL